MKKASLLLLSEIDPCSAVKEEDKEEQEQSYCFIKNDRGHYNKFKLEIVSRGHLMRENYLK